MVIGVFCALLLVTGNVFAGTAVKASTNAPVVVETVKSAPEAWVVSLGGSGAQSTDVSEGGFGIDLSIGRTGHLLLPLEAGIRQSVIFTDVNSDATTLFTTKVYGDWTLLTVKRLDVFAGANAGLTYGDTTPQWEIAPEAGVRLWVKDDVAILARAETPWNPDGWEYKDTVRYFLGFQVKF